MYFLSYKNTLSSILKFIYSSGIDIHNLNLENIRSSYLSVLTKLQDNTLNTNKGICYNYRDVKRNSGSLKLDEFIGGIEYLKNNEQVVFSKTLDEAFIIIKNFDENFYSIINLLISDIVVIKSDGRMPSMTLSKSIGILYILPPDLTYSAEKLAEIIIHESIHTLFFILDMVNKIFIGDFKNKKALSSVRVGKMRPYEASFHAAAVTISLMKFYDFQKSQDYYGEFISPLRDSISSLRINEDVLSAFGKKLLSEMEDFCA